VTIPLVVVDADVLGRRRTGDETYVAGILGALPSVAPDLRIAAIVRDASLAPAGVEPFVVRTPAQELRLAWSVPRLLRRVRPALVHFVYALPLGLRSPAVVTVQDLSWRRQSGLMPWKDQLAFRTVVPRAVRRAQRVIAISERTKDDLVELYDVPPEKVAVTLLAHDPAFSPDGDGGHDNFLLFVSAIGARKNPLAAADAAQELGMPLVAVGPPKDAALTEELRRRGVDVRGYVPKDELVRLYRRAAAVVYPSRYEGFGLPVVEAMACGTPVVATPDEAIRSVAGDAAVLVEPERLADGVRTALAERDRLVAAGLERAKAFSWEETARRTADVYREVLAG
jgi:glycosyltransferase involved in cell wall biosynthesis